jgi:hypothetical protein
MTRDKKIQRKIEGGGGCDGALMAVMAVGEKKKKAETAKEIQDENVFCTLLFFLL